MTLDEFISSSGKHASELARAVGITDASISRIRAGLQRPRIALALKIEDATGGAVTVRDLASTQPAGES